MAENGRIFYWKFAKRRSFFDFCGGDIWFLNFTNPKIAHNSLNNGVRAVLTPFLDFSFLNFLTWKSFFFWAKIQNWTKGCLQKKNRSYFVFSRQGGGGRAAKMELSRKSRKWAIFLLFQGEKSLIFRGFWDKGGGEGASFAVVSKRQNMSNFFLPASLTARGPFVRFYIYLTLDYGDFSFILVVDGGWWLADGG